ncbi:MAG TPA: gamma-glutamyltransferase family protein [Candidatus Limnocylindrales bacterium]|nr:gamma-glutamyltransferase family protein [Candidatus Limnocylindrales bacterium]
MNERPLVPAPLARGTHGAVVAPHHLATAAGLGILRAGGSAVDAAIATNAVLAVVAADSCGVGGDAFWLIWDAASRRQLALNGSGRSAAATDAAGLGAAGHQRIPVKGALSITVPGAVRSWGDAHARFGRLSRDVVLAPAIELARDGFAATNTFAAEVEAMAPLARAAVAGDGFDRVFRSAGHAWRPGDRVRLPALAATLERLAREGFDVFYDGDLGERQARALGAAGSPITAGDMREHRSTWAEPIGIDYRGVRATTHPPNSSGVVALQILGVLARLEPPAPTAFGPQGVTDAAWIHAGIEASKIALADRDRFLTDPEVHDVPVAELLDPSRLADIAAGIERSRSPGDAIAVNPGRGDTVYMATVDREGNAVSLIESNWDGFGSGVVDPETGIHYHNRGAYFSLEPESVNVLAPRKRPLHTLLPGMLFRDGDPSPWIVIGSMGGDAQPQVHAQFVSAVVDGRVDIATAVAAPRWFVQPRELLAPAIDVLFEPRHAAGLADELTARGHHLIPTAPFDRNVGLEHAIEFVDGGPAVGGSLSAATDPRSDGLPSVW